MNLKPLILPYKGKTPKISPNAFIAPSAIIIGDVTIGDGTGVWFHTVIRGDVEKITIGKNTNIQDGTVIHVTRNGHPTKIGDNVTIGHRAMIHACTIQSESFIGMGATILDDAIIETGGMVAAGSLVTKGKEIKKGEIWAGNPAKLFRTMSKDELDYILISANNYKKHADEYNEIIKMLKGGE